MKNQLCFAFDQGLRQRTEFILDSPAFLNVNRLRVLHDGFLFLGLSAALFG